MFKHLILLLLISCLSTAGFAQVKSGSVVYHVKFDTTAYNKRIQAAEDGSWSEDYRKRQKAEILLAIQYLSYTLKFNQHEAHLETPHFLESDNKIDLNFYTGLMGARGLYYTNTTTGINLHKFLYLNRMWVVKRHLDSLDWNITKETKQIMGYTCFKATAMLQPELLKKDLVTAWFCPSLPFQFGPFSHAGLPGLILEVKQSYYTFYATEVNLSPKSININPPKIKPNDREVSYAEYQKRTHTIVQQMKGEYK